MTTTTHITPELFSYVVQRIDSSWDPDAHILLTRYRQRMQEIRDLKTYRSSLERQLRVYQQDMFYRRIAEPPQPRLMCRRRLQPLIRLLTKREQ